MTVKPTSLELRNLLPGQGPAGVKCCGICGKPEGRADKHVKALPHHAEALKRDLPGQFRTFTKQVGEDKLLDFASRKMFNAQLESIRERLTLAREEHDAYVPPAKRDESERGMLRATLTQTLAMLGVEVAERPCPDAEDGQWSLNALADSVQYEIGVLMAIRADLEAPSMPTISLDERIDGVVLNGAEPA